jgi:hypothetical protein
MPSPLVSGSRSNTPTGVLINAPSIVTPISFAKSEARPFTPHANTDESICDHQAEVKLSVKILDTVSQADFSTEAFRFSGHVMHNFSEGKAHVSESRNLGGKDEHEIYLDNLRLFGEECLIEDDFLSEGHSFSLKHQNDDDGASWVEVDLRKYGWYESTWPKGMSPPKKFDS